MATYPPHSLPDWDDELKLYIDDSDNEAVAEALTGAALAQPVDWTKPSAFTRTTIRRDVAWSSALAAVTSGTLYLTGIFLKAGDVVNTISAMSGTTAAVSPTSQWFELRDAGRNLLRQTVNDGSVAWAANTVKTLAIMGAPYVVPTTGLYYLGHCVIASTVPTMSGVNPGMTTGIALPPVLCGNSTAGLTYGTSPALATAITPTAKQPFMGIA